MMTALILHVFILLLVSCLVNAHMLQYGRQYMTDFELVSEVGSMLDGPAANWYVNLFQRQAPELRNFQDFMMALRRCFESPFEVFAKDGTPPKGHPCVAHSQPWQVAVYKFFSFYCGAMLVDRSWVLTAAHCNNGAVRIRLGEENLDRFDGTEQYRHVIKTIVHPGYNRTTHSNDLMLLKLMTPARLNCYVQPLRLASQRAKPGDMCVVSGWGATINARDNIPLVLYCAKVKIISHKECEGEYPGRLNRKMVCAASLEGGTDSCEGDSGGPLVCNGRLQGVVSWGDVPCITSTKPGVYMDISMYVDWIKKTICEN